MDNLDKVNIPTGNISIDYTEKLDRSIVFTTPIRQDNILIGINYCKNSNNIQFKLSSFNTGEDLLKNESFEFRIYRNLDNSKICRKYLELEDFSNSKVDFKKKFKSIKYDSNIHLVNMMKEVYSFSLTNKCENSITVYGWYDKTFGPRDYQFFLIERKRFDKKQKITFVRTAAIELGYSDAIFSLGV